MSALVSPELIKTVVLLATSVTIVPLFKRLGLGSVLGYLVAGCLIGPSGAALFEDPNAVVHMAELGVVMFLFIIGLEMHPERLWSMRKAIFGRGFLQVAACGALLTSAGIFILGFPKEVAFIAGMGFTLSSTAIVMQVLEEKGISTAPKGQRIVSTLIFEDLAIVPLLASITFLAPTDNVEQTTNWSAIGAGLVGVLILVASGKWLMNPLFKMISKAHIREMMTAAALLVVLGSALLMELSGLSMAMGAFVAGVMLSESSFRHQLEADIEPFRGLLLGLFFMGVGMSLDLLLVANNWLWLLGMVVLYVAGKGLSVYLIGLITRLPHRESIMRTAIMSHGGEFAFVLFAAAATGGVISANQQATFTAAVIVSMLLSPLVIILIQRLITLRAKSATKEEQPNLEGIEFAENLTSSVLVIGFGRFSQVVCQALLARGISVSVIDSDLANIRTAKRLGFKVYYGDGVRIDVLRASGIEQVNSVIVGIAEPDRILNIVELIKHEFPLIPVFARSHDRDNTIDLIKQHVDYQVREVFESALLLSKVALKKLGATETEAEDVIHLVRHLDQERLNEEVLHGYSDEIEKKYWSVAPLVEKPAEPIVEPQVAEKGTEKSLTALNEADITQDTIDTPESPISETADEAKTVPPSEKA